MKKNGILWLFAVLIIITAGCSKDEESEIAPITYSSENHSILNSNASLYKEIMGEWKLVKAIPEGDTLLGIDYFCFYPDCSFTCNNVTESGTFHGKFEVNEQHNWEVGTIDYKHLPTNYCLWLYNDIEAFATFPFVIEGDKMHINVGGPSYVYSAFMFERVK